MNQDCAERPLIDFSALDELPPHRAAVPIPPLVFTNAHGSRRRHPPWPSIAVAIALHLGFLAAALRWGQGEALPPVEDAISVELVERIGAVGQPPATAQSAPRSEPAAEAQAMVAMTNAGQEAEAAADHSPASGAPEAGSSVLADADAQGEKPQAETTRPFRRPLEASLERLRTMRDGKLAELEVRASEERNALTPAQLLSPPLPVQKPLPQIAAAMSTEPMRPDDASPDASRASAAPLIMTMYKRRVRLRILRNLPPGIFGPGRVAIRLRLSPSGRVAGAAVLRSSGSSAMDRAALMSVYAAGPYPVPPSRAVPAQLAFAINFRFQ